MTSYWSVGHNMPGYLPMADELTVTDSWLTAVDILKEDIDHAYDMAEHLYPEVDVALIELNDATDNQPVHLYIGTEVHWVEPIDKETYLAWINEQEPF